jgi:hypothetical protein
MRLAISSGTEKVPPWMPSHMMASSIRIEPAMVYRKNLIAAYIRRGAAPDADQEVHRHQGELPEDEEQEQVLGQEHTHHAHFQQQEEDHEILDPLLDRLPGRQDRDRGQEGGQQHQQDAQPIDAHEIGDIPPATWIQGRLMTI